MKTEDFAKLLRRVGKSATDSEISIALNGVARVVETYPAAFRKPLQRVETDVPLSHEEVRDALVSIKLFLVQPTLADKFIDEPLRRRARIAMDKLWNAMLPDFEVKEQPKGPCDSYPSNSKNFECANCGFSIRSHKR
jgi:hypothetical protein